MTLNQHGGWKALFLGTWDIIQDGDRIGTVQRAKGLHGLRAAFIVRIRDQEFCFTTLMLGSETRLVRGDDPEDDTKPMVVMRRNLAGLLRAHTIHTYSDEIDLGIVTAIYHQYCIHMSKSILDWSPERG